MTDVRSPRTQQLKKALDKQYPGQWEINPGDGAFYGPKIDITIRDALRRSFQCATIQLDFQLPERFNLKYRSADDTASADKPPSRPVIIHRAILGSLERFIAIITEHFAGKWCVSVCAHVDKSLSPQSQGHSGYLLAKSWSFLWLCHTSVQMPPYLLRPTLTVIIPFTERICCRSRTETV